MGDKLPYDRQAGVAWSALTFGPARVLDTERLPRTWAAWFELTHTADGPICAQSTVHLLDALRAQDTEPDRPYCALILAADARSRLARQARDDRYLGATPGIVADSVPHESWRFLAEQVRRWEEQSVARRAVLISALTQLGFYQLAVRLTADVGRPADPAGQHLAYEAARAWRQAARSEPNAENTLHWLATEACDPALRVLACTQLISILLRDRKQQTMQRDWATAGESLLDSLDTAHPWLRALMVSRLWRAAAFQRVNERAKVAAATALDLAYLADEDTGRLAATPLERHCAKENRRLLFDVTVKAGTSICTPDRLATAVDGLLLLDGNEPSARYYIAALTARGGDHAAAAEEFDRAAMLGTLRGAAAAAKAAQCWQQAGETDRAGRSLTLLTELDPAARIPAGEEATR